jgi:hypothetical protein
MTETNAALTVWAVVNAVNVLQSIGFATRPRFGMAVNHRLGYAIAALAVPATVALVAYAQLGAGWLYLAGPLVFDAFVVLMLWVDYIRPVEFREPRRAAVLVPYLVLFFGSILLMGLPMFSIDRTLWLVTVATTVVLLASMGWAARKGVA